MITMLKAATIFSFVIPVISFGILVIVFGLLIWKTHRLTLIHTAYYDGVRAEDVRAYTSLVGFGVTLIGIGICLTGLLGFATRSYVLMRLPALAGLIAGFIFINKAQNDYNSQG